MLMSIIIPCKNYKISIDNLLQDINIQSVPFEVEIIKIVNISPVAKARNEGVKQAKGEILVFLDCDIRLGNELFLANLIKPLIEDKTIGITCASIHIPLHASRFQIRYTREMPHSESPIVDKLTEVSVASSACCALHKNVFFAIGGFNEDIIRGEDSILSDQLKKAGHRVVLAPQTWCYHPQPDNVIQLMETQFRNGAGVSFVDTFYPHLNIDVHPKGIVYFSGKKSILERINRFFISGFDAIFENKPLLFLSKLFYAIGYFYGIFKYTMVKPKKRAIGISKVNKGLFSLKSVKRILIINLAGIGDLLLSTPAIIALRALYPDAEISMLVPLRIYQIAKDLPYIDNVYTFDIAYGGKIPISKIFKNFKILFALRKKNIDLAINMRTLVSGKSASKIKVLMNIINPLVKVGRDTDGRGSFFDIKIPETRIGEKYEMEYDIDTVKILGGQVANREIDFKINEENITKVNEILEKAGVSGDDVIIGVHPGGMPSRRWPVENFAEIIKKLLSAVKVKFVITGGKEEAGLTKKLIKLINVNSPDVIDFTGKLNIKELGALIKRCSLFIANDTGPMHIAAILKTPLIAILGPGDITRYDPRNITDKAIVLYKKADCAPCEKTECDDLRCLKIISPEEVYKSALKLLNKNYV